MFNSSILENQRKKVNFSSSWWGNNRNQNEKRMETFLNSSAGLWSTTLGSTNTFSTQTLNCWRKWTKWSMKKKRSMKSTRTPTILWMILRKFFAFVKAPQTQWGKAFCWGKRWTESYGQVWKSWWSSTLKLNSHKSTWSTWRLRLWDAGTRTWCAD